MLIISFFKHNLNSVLLLFLQLDTERSLSQSTAHPFCLTRCIAALASFFKANLTVKILTPSPHLLELNKHLSAFSFLQFSIARKLPGKQLLISHFPEQSSHIPQSTVIRGDPCASKPWLAMQILPLFSDALCACTCFSLHLKSLRESVYAYSERGLWLMRRAQGTTVRNNHT